MPQPMSATEWFKLSTEQQRAKLIEVWGEPPELTAEEQKAADQIAIVSPAFHKAFEATFGRSGHKAL